MNQNGQLIESFTRGVGLAGDPAVAGLVAVTHHAGSSVTPGTYYTHHNHRGDVVIVRSGTTTVGSYDYSAFGNLKSAIGNDVSRFKFSSKERDPSTGWSYYGYRFYAPQWQRWVNPDPIGERGGKNLYGFVGNRPVVRLDAYGLQQCCKEVFTWPWNVGEEADRIEREEYGDYIDPFGGDYRHCVGACILARQFGPAGAACILKYRERSESDPQDTAAEWRGYWGAFRHPFTSCRELCKRLTVRPIGSKRPTVQ